MVKLGARDTKGTKNARNTNNDKEITRFKDAPDSLILPHS